MLSRSGPSPRLSIVIPAADAAALEDTLVSVLENRPADCEIIAALGMPYDDPWNIGEEVQFVQAPTGTGMVGRVNLGVAMSRGEVVHVLAAGWKATEGWADAALPHFDDPNVAAVAPVGVAADDRGRVVAAGVRRTAGGRGVLTVPARSAERVDSFRAEAVAAPAAPALEAGFWRVDVLSRGGFATACGDELAAADMAALLSCAGECVVLQPESRVVWGQPAKRPSSFVAGMNAERLFWRSLPAQAALPALMAHAFEIVRHAVATAPMGMLPMLAGRLMALVQFGSCLPRARELKALLMQSAPPATAGGEGPGMLRIDAGHALPSRPHSGGSQAVRAEPSAEPPLRRSA